MSYYLHKVSEGLLLNQNKRSAKSGIIFCSEGSVNTWKKAIENTEDITVTITKTF